MEILFFIGLFIFVYLFLRNRYFFTDLFVGAIVILLMQRKKYDL